MKALVLGALLLLSASSAAAALPQQGTLVPGRSLAGVHIGETAEQVTATLGRRHGVCRGCRTTTWYFTYHPFTQQGLAVELHNSHVTGVYTVWQPPGWRAPKGVKLGVGESVVTALEGPLALVNCSGYDAWTHDEGAAQTVYYMFNHVLWGYGLLTAGAAPCR